MAQLEAAARTESRAILPRPMDAPPAEAQATEAQEVEAQVDEAREVEAQEVEAHAAPDLLPALQRQVHGAFVEMKEAVTEAVDCIANAGAADQIRGRLNETIGAAKFAVGRAIESPELAFAGIIQKALGEVQQTVGDAKVEEATPGDAPKRSDAF